MWIVVKNETFLKQQFVVLLENVVQELKLYLDTVK